MSRNAQERAQLLEALNQEFRQLSMATIMFHQAVADRLRMNVTDHKCADLVVRAGRLSAGELARRTGLTSRSLSVNCVAGGGSPAGAAFG